MFQHNVSWQPVLLYFYVNNELENASTTAQLATREAVARADNEYKDSPKRHRTDWKTNCE